LTNWSHLISYRRLLGLTCFGYALLHFLTWLVIDHQFDVEAILKDFFKRTYITVGLLAFLLLIPLAITSNHSMQKRLGRKWKKLHQMIYPIAILVPLHYWLHKAAKNNLFTVKIYIGIIAVLLTYRLYHRFKRNSAKLV
jgi:sulfoxide reductase heme-binding subunit YedZ